MNTNQSATMYESVPVVSELNKVQGFDPLKFLRRTTKGEKVLDLKYKKLWFRLKYPNGRIKLSSLKITDQLAIIEARVYFDKNDAQPRSSFIAQREAKATPGGLYIESAQHAAIDQALSDAGFGVQFSAAAPTASAEKAAETVKEQPTVFLSRHQLIPTPLKQSCGALWRNTQKSPPQKMSDRRRRKRRSNPKRSPLMTLPNCWERMVWRQSKILWQVSEDE